MSPELLLKPLLGETITSIEGASVGQDEIVFDTESGKRFRMFHNQDCCESVSIHSITGDVSSIIGSPVLSALEDESNTNPPLNADSFTWTTFSISTEKGTLEIKWLGESNGYYSEDVSFQEIKP